jgi:hypothetical protein
LSQTRCSWRRAWARATCLRNPPEFLVAVARCAVVDDPSGRDLQRREQGGGAVSGVVVGALLGASRPHAADGLGALEGLDLGFLVYAQHDRDRVGAGRAR